MNRITLTPISTNELCIVTPVYKDSLDDAELLSFRLGDHYLSNYDRYILMPDKLKGGKIHTHYQYKYLFVFWDNSYFESTLTYNKLMLTADFYAQYKRYRYMLIYHTDSLIFNNTFSEWLNGNYSYIGAPWINSEEDQQQKGTYFNGVGNGGFSLRYIPHHISVLKSRKKITGLREYLNTSTNKDLFTVFKRLYHYLFQVDSYRSVKHNHLFNEDKILSGAAKRFSYFRVPPAEIALRFAFEAEPEHLFKLNNQQLPLGCHLWQKYGPDFYTRLIDPQSLTT